MDQTSVTGGATVTLNADKTYTVTLVDGSTVSGLYFGNRCLGGGNARGIGFWTSRNGQALYGADDNTMLASLNLRNAGGSDFDPTGYAQFGPWILGATAVNMAYALSAQLAAAELNVWNGFVSGGSLISAPGTESANALGFATVGAVMAEANTSLGANGYTPADHPERAHQAALKNALEGVNNNTGFVQPGPETCPAPVFP